MVVYYYIPMGIIVRINSKYDISTVRLIIEPAVARFDKEIFFLNCILLYYLKLTYGLLRVTIIV